MRSVRVRWHVPLALVALTALAAVLRFRGLHFGLPLTMARPDEEAITTTAAQIVLHGPNPKFFDYPTLFMYLVALVERLWPGGGAVADDELPTMIARTAAATLGVLSVPLLYASARRLFAVRTGLIAGALLAVAFLHVRDSHFGVTDVPMTFMVLLAFYAIVIVWRQIDSARQCFQGSQGSQGSQGFQGQQGQPGLVVLAATACGLAASTKYNAILIALPLAVALWQAKSPPWMFAIALAGIAIGFLVGTPYALITRDKFLAGLTGLQAHLASGHATDEGFGWSHHLTFSLRYGVGVPFLAAALGGMFWLSATDRRRAALVLSFPVAYYVVMGSGRTVFVRHMTPMVPFVALLAAITIDRVATAAGRAMPSLPGAGAIAAACLTVALGADSAVRVVALDRLLRQRDSRSIAAKDIRARFPQGASVYQNGAIYGHAQLWPEGIYPVLPVERSPRLIILQTSRLVAYSAEPDGLRASLALRYRLLRRIEVEDPTRAVTPVFDQQDAFFVPLTGFERFIRPGPAIEIFERVDD
ncbi:MAG TPA: phospholipid carrier-dependent glycosyltransferase [Vicinamibacterales bacterium]|nr:phospholipid carrier-dependent glycosyltransferase [Vicinamibacterales bacterium]